MKKIKRIIGWAILAIFAITIIGLLIAAFVLYFVQSIIIVGVGIILIVIILFACKLAGIDS